MTISSGNVDLVSDTETREFSAIKVHNQTADGDRLIPEEKFAARFDCCYTFSTDELIDGPVSEWPPLLDLAK